MSLVKRWAGVAAPSSAAVVYCLECGGPVLDTPASWEAHRQRRHALKPVLVRLPSTLALEDAKPTKRPYRRASEQSGMCEACRAGDCLLCDGDDCRCVCALELDEKHARRRPA